MNGTQIPKDFNNIKSKFQKIDEANKRRLEIIKNKDKIEKSVSEIETIYEKVKNLDKMDLEKFLKEKPEQFLQNFDTKIDEIEKRRTGLKIVQEMANERIELLQLFPDILESEKGTEILNKKTKIDDELLICEENKNKLKEMKKTYENNLNIEKQKVHTENTEEINKDLESNELKDIKRFPKILDESVTNTRDEFNKISSPEIKRYFEEIITRVDRVRDFPKKEFNTKTYNEDLEEVEKIERELKTLYKEAFKYEGNEILTKNFNEIIFKWTTLRKESLLNSKIHHNNEIIEKISRVLTISGMILIGTTIGFGVYYGLEYLGVKSKGILEFTSSTIGVVAGLNSLFFGLERRIEKILEKIFN